MSSVKDHKELNELLTKLMNCKQDIVWRLESCVMVYCLFFEQVKATTFYSIMVAWMCTE